MARELRGGAASEPVLDESEEAGADAPVATAEKPKAAAKGVLLGNIELKAWDGKKDSLPKASYGKTGKFQRNGEPRHQLIPAGANKYKVLAVFRSRGGVSRRLLAVLRDSKKHPAAQAMIRSLKREGFLAL